MSYTVLHDFPSEKDIISEKTEKNKIFLNVEYEKQEITFNNQVNNSEATCIILGYYNGEEYINEQLQSILSQTHTCLKLYIFDDCSNFHLSIKNLDIDHNDHSKISICNREENIGFSANFLNGLANVPKNFEYYAFCDQDDIWNESKIEEAINKLKKIPNEEPALYCSRTAIKDHKCEKLLGYSPLFRKPASFKNALVQNIGGGNTMVFNRAARDLVVKTLKNLDVISHDWWCYQIISGAGGHVIYDPKPCLKYRQHSNSQIGSNNSWLARLVRIRALLQGRFHLWNEINLKALRDNKNLLTIDNQHILDDFIKLRKLPFLKRLSLFKRSGIYRQTALGNLGLLLGIILNKV